MICTKCYCLGVYHKYHSFEYYYCSTCKEEISLEVETKALGIDPQLDLWDDIQLNSEMQSLYDSLTKGIV